MVDNIAAKLDVTRRTVLRDKQIAGVEITIVTWEPDSYGFGDAGFWMQLHEEMRQAGFGKLDNEGVSVTRVQMCTLVTVYFLFLRFKNIFIQHSCLLCHNSGTNSVASNVYCGT